MAEQLLEMYRTLTLEAQKEAYDFVMYLATKPENITSVQNKEIESKLDEADLQATSTDERLTHEEVFSNIRSKIKVG